MGVLSEHFSSPKGPILLAVIHAESEQQSLMNTGIAFGEGCDGVFLVNHGISSLRLREIFYSLRGHFDKKWIGVNFLDVPMGSVLNSIPDSANGFWIDNAGHQADSNDPVFLPREFSKKRIKSAEATKSLYFGGVSFKHQHATDDIPAACLAAVDCRPFVDVITTSGTQTGTPPTVDKIKAMHAVLEGHPLAVASGLTPDNVQPFLPYLSAILCATGISRTFFELDPIKVKRMVKTVHG